MRGGSPRTLAPEPGFSQGLASARQPFPTGPSSLPQAHRGGQHLIHRSLAVVAFHSFALGEGQTHVIDGFDVSLDTAEQAVLDGEINLEVVNFEQIHEPG